MRFVDLIARKRDGGEHPPEEIRALVRGVADGSLPDYQAAAWLMAAFLRGLSPGETLELTLAMRDSGVRVDLSSIPGIKLDKHSSGGVGDKTTLVVVPMLAAAGVPVLKMSGRGLGHTGGTVDKLESIPGFRTGLSLEEALAQVRAVGAALVGQSAELVPADKRLYVLRDVTATVDSIPLIAASIMSKKLASGADRVLLDVKVGRGAFMKSLDKARELARLMVRLGGLAGVETTAALTAMDEPLGWAVGSALEVAEACATLTGGPRVDRRFRELCVRLCARGLVMAEKVPDELSGIAAAERLLECGEAAGKFQQILQAQGASPAVVSDPGLLPRAPLVAPVESSGEGFVAAIDSEAIGRLVMEMGGGRARKEDAIDPAVGIVLHRKTGDPVRRGGLLAEVHLARPEEEAAGRVLAAFTLAPDPPPESPIIYEFVNSEPAEP